MIKYYLKDSKKEVKMGDKLNITVPIGTPYGTTKCKFDVIITQGTLKQLIKDKLIEEKEVPIIDIEKYRYFIRKLAEKNDWTIIATTDLMDLLKSTSLAAHNALLLDLIAQHYNSERSKSRVVFTISTDGMYIVSHDITTTRIASPSFYNYSDAEKALAFMQPFYEAMNERQ
jgi:hypothetical protein